MRELKKIVPFFKLNKLKFEQNLQFPEKHRHIRIQQLRLLENHLISYMINLFIPV